MRVDLSYIKAEQSSITIDDVYRHLKEFIRPVSARYCLFKHLVGHAYTIEQGVYKGYHIHAIFYFKGRHQWKDWYQAKEIIRFWKQITCNKGCGYNCNAEIKSYIEQDKCGIGMIMRKDEHAVNCSIKAACYLTRIKEDPQHLRARPHGARSFNTGSLKKAIKRSRLVTA